MEPNEIQKSILKWITVNYESTKIIRQNVCDDLGRAISDESFSSALLGLHSTGFVTSYIYDNQTEEYISLTEPDEHILDVVYWLATKKSG